MSLPTLILASGSPRRRQLLEMLGVSFQTIVSDADETLEATWTASQAVEELAHRKSEAVRRELSHEATLNAKNVVIVAADTIVCVDGDILGKPKDAQHALSMLTRLQGRMHDVYTGISVHNTKTGQLARSHVHTKVWMKSRDSDWLQAYIKTKEPLDKAGAYGIQDTGSLLVDRIDGDFYSVMGLPLSRLDTLLMEMGTPLLSWRLP